MWEVGEKKFHFSEFMGVRKFWEMEKIPWGRKGRGVKNCAKSWVMVVGGGGEKVSL